MAGVPALGIVQSFPDLFNVSVSISGTLPAAHSQLQGISEPGLLVCGCTASLVTDVIALPWSASLQI